MGNEIDQIISDEEFLDLYAVEGRPAVNPVILALVSVFQFLEKLPDRAAAEAAVMRLDWKYALRQELTWMGFHYSDLCNFRKRLLAHEREWVVFERLVAYLRERGYIPERGKQRTDSTKIIGLVARLSRLELVWEAIRVALRALGDADASWVRKQLPVSFVETYGQRAPYPRSFGVMVLAGLAFVEHGRTSCRCSLWRPQPTSSGWLVAFFYCLGPGSPSGVQADLPFEFFNRIRGVYTTPWVSEAEPRS